MSNDNCVTCGGEEHGVFACDCFKDHEDHMCSICGGHLLRFHGTIHCGRCDEFVCLLRECRKKCNLCSDTMCLKCSREEMVDGYCLTCHLIVMHHNDIQRSLTMQEHCLKAILEATGNRLEQLRVKRRRIL